jgi:hypothetical protein
MTTSKLTEKTIDSGLISIEQKSEDQPIYLLQRSFSGQIHFTSFIFPKSSKVKDLEKLKVKIMVSVYNDKKYSQEHVEITFLEQKDKE